MNDVLQETIKELQKIPWFQELEKKHLEKVASITTLRHVRPDEALFHEGDKEDNLYIVIAGRIALEIFVPHRGGGFAEHDHTSVPDDRRSQIRLPAAEIAAYSC